MAQKISVIIPNFNGRLLLAKNLPDVVKNCPGCEIIVVDDASTDDSAQLVRKNFKGVKLLVNKNNLGFAKSVNRGVEESAGELIILLNSDVAPREDFLKFALAHFKDKKVFAVGLADQSHENNKIITRGRGGAKFEKGLVRHFAAKNESGETLWVSGGSGLFDKKKFQELGGLDPIFAPFYWEDIDLGYRAQKAGFICLFEPKAKVDHFHEEGAIKKSFSPFFIKTVSYKNQFLFVWKNISDYWLLTQHLLWFPYHLAKSLITLDIAFLAGFLWALSQIPQLIFSTTYTLYPNPYPLTDKEILRKFEKL